MVVLSVRIQKDFSLFLSEITAVAVPCDGRGNGSTPWLFSKKQRGWNCSLIQGLLLMLKTAFQVQSFG